METYGASVDTRISTKVTPEHSKSNLGSDARRVGKIVLDFGLLHSRPPMSSGTAPTDSGPAVTPLTVTPPTGLFWLSSTAFSDFSTDFAGGFCRIRFGFCRFGFCRFGFCSFGFCRFCYIIIAGEFL